MAVNIGAILLLINYHAQQTQGQSHANHLPTMLLKQEWMSSELLLVTTVAYKPLLDQYCLEVEQLEIETTDPYASIPVLLKCNAYCQHRLYPI